MSIRTCFADYSQLRGGMGEGVSGDKSADENTSSGETVTWDKTEN